MKTPYVKLVQREEDPKTPDRINSVYCGITTGTLVGSLVTVEANGLVKVDYPNNEGPPLNARATINLSENDQNKKVLITFENGNPQLPIIIGIIQDHPVVSKNPEQLNLNRKNIKDVTLDGECITFNAQQEIVLRCGEGSIKLRRDGTVIIKGIRLVSRAKTVNRILGASVNIN